MTQKINRDKQFNGIVNTLNQSIVDQISLNQNFRYREVNTKKHFSKHYSKKHVHAKEYSLYIYVTKIL